MTATEVLVEMLARFRDGEAWCQGVAGQDANGEYVSYRAPEAVRWCLSGMHNAVLAHLDVCMRPAQALWDESRKRIERVVGTEHIAEWNDAQPNFGPVRAALLAAIEGGK